MSDAEEHIPATPRLFGNPIPTADAVVEPVTETASDVSEEIQEEAEEAVQETPIDVSDVMTESLPDEAADYAQIEPEPLPVEEVISGDIEAFEEAPVSDEVEAEHSEAVEPEVAPEPVFDDLQERVFENLSNSLENGYFNPGESCHGMSAEDLVTELLAYAANVESESARNLLPHVQAWLAQADLPTEAQPVAETESVVVSEDERDAVLAEDTQPKPDSPDSIEALRAQQAALEQAIKDKQVAERKEVLDQIVHVMETFKVSPEELLEALGNPKIKRKGVPAKVKYKDPATGATWSGRGKEPAWIRGQDRSNFLV